ncbi:MAG: hypothetical protein HY819_20365 [Acidobacteria bacterium]|nr:hypothetical protein [Acidobacteriota bacterium]
MIGIWGSYSTTYLYIITIGTIVFFGLPMLISPIHWARVLGWDIADKPDLAVYFGRCLGAVICVLGIFGLKASRNPLLKQYFFDLLIYNFILMFFVHIYGWLKKIQPIAETLEIIYWAGLIILTLLFYPNS